MLYKQIQIRLRSELGLAEGSIREIMMKIEIHQSRLKKAMRSGKQKSLCKLEKEAIAASVNFVPELAKYKRTIDRIKKELGELNGIDQFQKL